MSDPLHTLQVQLQAQKERAAFWMNKAQEHAREEAQWRALLAAMLRTHAHHNMATIAGEIVQRIIEEGWSIERVVDPASNEVMLRLYKEEDEATEPSSSTPHSSPSRP